MRARTANSTTAHRLKGLFSLAVAALLLSSSGCTWMKQQIAGEGFQGWNNDLGQSVRNQKQDKPEHSGYFLDTKAQQIEQNLGGSFN